MACTEWRAPPRPIYDKLKEEAIAKLWEQAFAEQRIEYAEKYEEAKSFILWYENWYTKGTK